MAARTGSVTDHTSKDRYALMGHPVGHSRSPFIHAMFAKQTEQAMSYEVIDVVAEDLNSAVARFMADGGHGLNFTVPHKQAAANLADKLTERAKTAGAVNTFQIDEDGVILGDNTDGAGLVRDLTVNEGIDITDSRVLILGAGGAVRGILGPLLNQGPDKIVIANRNVDRGSKLAERFEDVGSIEARGFTDIQAEVFDIVINATSASLTGDLPPIPVEVIGSGTVCYDLAYGQTLTEFNRWAKEAGAGKTLAGLGMLVEQAAEAFFLWRGMRPDTQIVRAALAARG